MRFTDRPGRREVHVNTRTLGRPSLHGRMRVSRVIVGDRVQFLLLGRLALDLSQELQPLEMVMPLHLALLIAAQDQRVLGRGPVRADDVLELRYELRVARDLEAHIAGTGNRPEYPMSSPAGKVVVVTGASRGIGKGIAIALGAEGATVHVTGRSVVPRGYPLPGTVGETALQCTERGGKIIPTLREQRSAHLEAGLITLRSCSRR